MRAYWIKTDERRVVEVEFNGLDELQCMVGGSIECAMHYRNGDTLYVNEDGLSLYRHFFIVIGAHQPFAGNGVYVGKELDRDGTRLIWANPRVSSAGLTANIRFPTPAQLYAATSAHVN